MLLAVAASTFVLFGSTVATDRAEASLQAPPGATGVSVSERQTEDGRYLVRRTVRYASGRTEVREYIRSANVENTTLLEAQPAGTIAIVAIALTVAGFPLVLNRTALRRPARALAAILLGVGSLLAALSVGVMYLPSAAAMAIAAVMERSTRGW